MGSKHEMDQVDKLGEGRKQYASPELQCYGDVRSLTQAGSTQGAEGGGPGGVQTKTPKP